MLDALLLNRPIIVVLAGPNGAGKSTFFSSQLAQAGLRFVNADLLARALKLSAQQAMEAADALRSELIRQRESFITETVFSDPVGAKLNQFTNAMAQGYTVFMLFIGISGPERSDERVAMRVSQGGHDVPPDRVIARFPRTLANLRSALRVLSGVLVYDNDDLRHPYRLIARVIRGEVEEESQDLPTWWIDIRH
jgi:predicted ABC-type ATPase